MAGQVKASIRKLVEGRDDHCWHCGTDTGLVVHHRRNRGMGGAKSRTARENNTGANGPANLLMVCADYNFQMESNAKVAARARGWGHKLSQWNGTEMPVFDCVEFAWYVLTPQGEKIVIDDISPFI